MSTIAGFLHARFDEDERTATEGAAGPGKDWDAVAQGPGRERDGVLWDDDHANVIAWFDDHLAAAQHAALHDPARVLREVEAGRKILAEHARIDDGWLPGDHVVCAACGGYTVEAGMGDRGYRKPWPCPTVRLLAAVWCDSPDYDEAWRP